MKRLLLILMTALLTTPAGFAREQTILARITVYWPSGTSAGRASSNGSKLRNGPSSRSALRGGPAGVSKTNNELSSGANSSTGNSVDGPTEVGGPLLLTPSGTALPRS